MNYRNFRIVFLALIMGISFSVFGSCSKSVEAKKTDAAAGTQQGAEAAAPMTPELKEIVDRVKEMYICPRIDMSIKEAEESGALCPQGKKILDWVGQMYAGKMTKEDIYHLVENYKQQGRAIVENNFNASCEKDSKLKLEFFIVSYCPYGVRYVDNILHPMINALGDTLEWKPMYIMNDAGNGKPSSMHGQEETDENLREICLRDKWGNAKWLSYMDCFSAEVFNKRGKPDAKDWKFCAEQAGVSVGELQKCFDTEAVALAKPDMEWTMKYRVTGSPTAVYNCSKNIVGAIPFEQIKPKLCKLIPGQAPAACAN